MEPSTEPGESAARTTGRAGAGRRVSAYNSVAQLQTDLWWSISDVARRLSLAEPDSAGRAEAVGVLDETLADVDVLTHYYSYPGPEVAQTLRALASEESYAELSRTAARIGRG